MKKILLCFSIFFPLMVMSNSDDDSLLIYEEAVSKSGHAVFKTNLFEIEFLDTNGNSGGKNSGSIQTTKSTGSGYEARFGFSGNIDSNELASREYKIFLGNISETMKRDYQTLCRPTPTDPAIVSKCKFIVARLKHEEKISEEPTQTKSRVKISGPPGSTITSRSGLLTQTGVDPKTGRVEYQYKQSPKRSDSNDSYAQSIFHQLLPDGRLRIIAGDYEMFLIEQGKSLSLLGRNFDLTKGVINITVDHQKIKSP